MDAGTGGPHTAADGHPGWLRVTTEHVTNERHSGMRGVTPHDC